MLETIKLDCRVEKKSTEHKIVKVHGAEEYEMGRFMEKADRLRRFALKSAVAGGLNQPITQLIASMALSIVFVIALMQSATNVGSAIKHAPNAPRCTRSDGQPQLRLISL